MFFLVSFAVAFFLAPTVMPHVLDWKARKLVAQSKAYRSEVLANTTGLMETGIVQARIATLLLPDEIDILRNYVELLTLADPLKVIIEWERMLDHPMASLEDREKLVRHCLNLARAKTNAKGDKSRVLAMTVAKRQLLGLIEKNDWVILPASVLLRAEFLAEVGESGQSLKLVTKLLEQTGIDSPDVVFLYAKLATHLGHDKHLVEAGRLLAGIARQPDTNGLEAIRHMTLIHTVLPLATKGLDFCLKLVESNPKAHLIDYLRLHALRFDSATKDHERKAILQECSDLFDLEENRELEVYSRWLGRLRAFSQMLNVLPPARARISDNLFKLRMSALAALERNADMKKELANAPAISLRWKLAVSARLFAFSGNFDKATKTLDQLLDEIGPDTRLLYSICQYLEDSGDIHSLCHVLERQMEAPGIKRYALDKLLQHRASSAPLAELRLWISKLRNIHADDPSLQNAGLYFDLLDTNISKSKIASIAKQASGLLSKHNEQSFRITAALAHLLNQEPDKALLALGEISDWHSFRETRPAWLFICAQTLRRNQDTQTAKRLESGIIPEKMDLAERHSLASLFPENFPSSTQ